MRRAGALALAVAALAALPAAAAGHEVIRTSGTVTAKLSWQGNYVKTKKFRLAIERGGVPVYDAAVRSEECGKPVRGFPCLWPPNAGRLALRDLDGDGEPEAVVAGFTGGAHCCLLALVYRWDGTTYVKSENNFRDPGYQLSDLDGNGRYEFLSADARFAYLYGSYAESVFPIQIVAFAGGRFSEVTRDFRAEVAEHSGVLKREYQRRAQSRRKIGVRAAIAAYVADLYLLNRNQEAKQTLSSALEKGLLARQNRFDVGPFGRKFIHDLNRNLRHWGYR